MILVYLKSTDSTEIFESVLEKLPQDKISVLTENGRSFELLDAQALNEGDIVAAVSIYSLGISAYSASERIRKLMECGVSIVLCRYPATYEYGVNKASNHPAVAAILESVDIPETFRTKAGRPRLAFPENWDTLYEKWKKKEITSAEFIEQSGLKRASFYNLLAEYKSLLKSNEEFVRKYS